MKGAGGRRSRPPQQPVRWAGAETAAALETSVGSYQSRAGTSSRLASLAPEKTAAPIGVLSDPRIEAPAAGPLSAGSVRTNVERAPGDLGLHEARIDPSLGGRMGSGPVAGAQAGDAARTGPPRASSLATLPGLIETARDPAPPGSPGDARPGTERDPLSPAPMRNPGLDRAQLLDLYYYMRLNRSVEERLVHLYKQGKVVGGLYRSRGQEATAVGAAYALERGDLLGPLIRDLGAVLVRGYTPRECFTQHMARAASPTLGRDCVLHMGEVGGRGVISAVCMLGDLISVMAGCALGFTMRGSDRVCLTFIGDGGTSTGGFHEGMNLAAVRKLPLVVVIENNGYAYSTPVSRQTRQTDFSARGPAYGCPGVRVDGNDVLAIHEAAREAVARARKGGGPTVIESLTFRMEGHAQHDDASYVPKELIEQWRQKDPLERYERWLRAESVLSEKEILALAAGIDAQLEEDVRWADACPMPDPESGLAGVYAADSPFHPPAYAWPARERGLDPGEGGL